MEWLGQLEGSLVATKKEREKQVYREAEAMLATLWSGAGAWLESGWKVEVLMVTDVDAFVKIFEKLYTRSKQLGARFARVWRLVEEQRLRMKFVWVPSEEIMFDPFSRAEYLGRWKEAGELRGVWAEMPTLAKVE